MLLSHFTVEGCRSYHTNTCHYTRTQTHTRSFLWMLVLSYFTVKGGVMTLTLWARALLFASTPPPAGTKVCVL